MFQTQSLSHLFGPVDLSKIAAYKLPRTKGYNKKINSTAISPEVFQKGTTWDVSKDKAIIDSCM